LAQIIPPSLVLIIMADQLGKSVGDMYAGAFVPGLVLTGLYAIYVMGCSIVRPNWAPALPLEARTIREPNGKTGNVSLIVLVLIAVAASVGFVKYHYLPVEATDVVLVVSSSVGVGVSFYDAYLRGDLMVWMYN